MKKHILIAYGTRFGATKEVAEELSSLLAKRGHQSSLVDIENTPQKEWPPVTDFRGILVGTSIKMGRWMRGPTSYLATNKKHLQGDTPLGIFVCSGFAADPDKRPNIRREYITKVLAELGIQANLADAFGGVIDLAKSSTMGWFDKVIMGRAAKKDLTIKQNQRNDLRDWNQIRQFGETFAHLLESTSGA